MSVPRWVNANMRPPRKRPKKRKKVSTYLPVMTPTKYAFVKLFMAYTEELGRTPTYDEAAAKMKIDRARVGYFIKTCKKYGILKENPMKWIYTEPKVEDIEVSKWKMSSHLGLLGLKYIEELKNKSN
jgi:hypothetical protein